MAWILSAGTRVSSVIAEKMCARSFCLSCIYLYQDVMQAHACDFKIASSLKPGLGSLDPQGPATRSMQTME